LFRVSRRVAVGLDVIVPEVNFTKEVEDMPLAKRFTTRVIAKRIQEDWTSSEHYKPKLNFI